MNATDRRRASNREYRNTKFKAKPWVRWYGTKGWKAKRAKQLHLFPQCQDCVRMRVYGVLATDVDHVIPHRGDKDLFWKGALRSLCETCHRSAKQAEETRGYSTATPADTGWPTDKAHPFNTGVIPPRKDTRRRYDPKL